MEYGQFCPIAKATEIIGEKWTILIIRELLMGGSRLPDFTDHPVPAAGFPGRSRPDCKKENPRPEGP
jgi:hypothetical protein